MSGQHIAVDAFAASLSSWASGAGISALTTTRPGGVSRGEFGTAHGRCGGLNLGEHCGDDPQAVVTNRARIRAFLPANPVWLRQVHGVAVCRPRVAPQLGDAEFVADAAVSDVPGVVLAVLSADCLPVLLADPVGPVVGIAHAGWRGLAAGVIEATVSEMLRCGARPERMRAYLGPAIGPNAFEVGEDVVSALRGGSKRDDPAVQRCFVSTGVPGKWHANLYALARLRLGEIGVNSVAGGAHCTFGEPELFYSFRRDGRTGRMGTFVWIDSAA